jgi:hypothetical protein
LRDVVSTLAVIFADFLITFWIAGICYIQSHKTRFPLRVLAPKQADYSPCIYELTEP